MGDPLVFPALFFLYLLFLTVKGQAVKLTRTEYAILKLLMENPKQVIAKSVLLDRISLDTPDCTECSLKQHISNLRKKCRMSVVQIILKLYGALVSNWQFKNLDQILTIFLTTFLTILLYTQVIKELNNMDYVLQTNSLTKKYKNFQALNDLSMNVPKGSIYGFVGKMVRARPR